MNDTPSPTLNPTTQERIQSIITFLEPLQPEKFDFQHIVSDTDEHGCGTVCCAVGWFPAIFPEDFKWCPGFRVVPQQYPRCLTTSVGNFLQIPHEVVQALFYNCKFLSYNTFREYYDVEAEYVTKDMVVSALKYYLTHGELAAFKEGIIQ